MEEKIDPPTRITVKKDESHNNQQFPRAPQHEESNSKDGVEDEEDSPIMAQDLTQIMDNINALFIEETTWQKSLFDQVIASQAILNQRRNVLS